MEGLVDQPYIHLDIRTPFGETVGATQVESAFAESLGARQDNFRRGGWHIQYVEDTNLGSNHRIFLDLEDPSNKSETVVDRDACIPLEAAMEALGELVMEEKGEGNFQLLYGSGPICFSLLYVNGSPFHVLRLDAEAGPKTALRLRQHREFALTQGKIAGSGLKTYLATGDPLAQCEALHALKPQSISLGLPTRNANSNPLLLHLGLAHAARQKDLLAHNRVDEKNRFDNALIRDRSQFFLVVGIATVFCLVAVALMSILIQQDQRQLQKLEKAASAYAGQVATISKLKREKTAVETDLQSLKPVWNRPMNWAALFAEIAKALPNEAGMDGLSVVRKPDGHLEVTFRSWVKDWDKVQSIQNKLSATALFSKVTLSEQRKDLTSGVVVFHVTGQLVRN